MGMGLYIVDPHTPPQFIDFGDGPVAVTSGIDTGIHMSGTNAVKTMEELGFAYNQADCTFEEFNAGQLLEACCKWLNSPAPIIADGGVAATIENETGVTFIHCGRRPGYLAERITEIRDAALKAIGLGGLTCGMYLV